MMMSAGADSSQRDRTSLRRALPGDFGRVRHDQSLSTWARVGGDLDASAVADLEAAGLAARVLLAHGERVAVVQPDWICVSVPK